MEIVDESILKEPTLLLHSLFSSSCPGSLSRFTAQTKYGVPAGLSMATVNFLVHILVSILGRPLSMAAVVLSDVDQDSLALPRPLPVTNSSLQSP